MKRFLVFAVLARALCALENSTLCSEISDAAFYSRETTVYAPTQRHKSPLSTEPTQTEISISSSGIAMIPTSTVYTVDIDVTHVKTITILLQLNSHGMSLSAAEPTATAQYNATIPPNTTASISDFQSMSASSMLESTSQYSVASFPPSVDRNFSFGALPSGMFRNLSQNITSNFTNFSRPLPTPRFEDFSSGTLSGTSYLEPRIALMLLLFYFSFILLL